MKRQKQAGIYMIQCTINNRIYIGQSRDLKARLSKHKRHLRDNKHENKALQAAWNTYQESCFEFTILETYEGDNLDNILNKRERELITYYRSNKKPFGYNHTDGGGSFRMNKDVIRRGEKVSKVLTDSDVINIRNYIKNNKYSCAELAEKYNVHIQTIHYIRRGDNWSHLTNGERVGNEYTFNRGEDNSNSKLTQKGVQDIIILLKIGVTIPKIAKIYQLSRDTIWDIRNGESWVHVTGGKVNKLNIPLRGEDVPTAKLTDKTAIEIVERYKKGARRKDLVKEFGIANTTLRELLAGNTWAHITGGKKVEREVVVGLNRENAKKVIELYKQGWTQREISKELDVAPTTIFHLLNGNTWSSLTGGIKIESPNKKVKLTENDVRKIVYMLKEKENLQNIAKTYGVSISHIQNIRDGFRWNHITGGKII
ncbi:hypothetical protein ES895_09980 [Bacillus sp. 007/AIA-02/001]|uniref:GIY-YIG nuclease family protein n=1 Tax=Bacillus sp. 007/AIA-02/001 TaxID=2509009 RepID=UPI0010754C60|nr:GIY-YIG nuclease family protein [Bacillus sp. 007/AIA-02/001]TFW53165.1 hypothetical protein ES895_09980 [Bacillus sp. 007/AIA-02/001]